MTHPFTEFDADKDIGHLKWRIRRRAEAMRDSQDGLHIMRLEKHQEEERAELKALLEARDVTANRQEE